MTADERDRQARNRFFALAGLRLAGVPVDGVAFWVPQTAAVGVGVSLFSYAGTVRIGVAVDAGLVPDAQELATALDAALDELLR